MTDTDPCRTRLWQKCERNDMENETRNGLFEELGNIIRGASVGNCREPVWDGTVIGKPNQHTLVKMGLVEHCHGYYFPTEEGKKLFKLLG